MFFVLETLKSDFEDFEANGNNFSRSYISLCVKRTVRCTGEGSLKGEPSIRLAVLVWPDRLVHTKQVSEIKRDIESAYGPEYGAHD